MAAGKFSRFHADGACGNRQLMRGRRSFRNNMELLTEAERMSIFEIARIMDIPVEETGLKAGFLLACRQMLPGPLLAGDFLREHGYRLVLNDKIAEHVMTEELLSSEVVVHRSKWGTRTSTMKELLVKKGAYPKDDSDACMWLVMDSGTRQRIAGERYFRNRFGADAQKVIDGIREKGSSFLWKYLAENSSDA